MIVVRVSPVAVPPCLTVDGLAFERVTNQTKKVDDSVRLADLLRQGQTATSESERKARAAAAHFAVDYVCALGGNLVASLVRQLGGSEKHI